MKYLLRSTGCLVAALFAANAAVAQTAAKPMTVQLDPQNASGAKGTVTLTPEGSDKTRVVITMTGAAGTPHPAHIHEGTCAELNPKPKIPLQNIVQGTSTTVVAMGLDKIIAGKNAINVHKSAEDIKTYIACGNLTKG